jgi:mannose-6-phosphate isomerase-like protein (cupin superfamily)
MPELINAPHLIPVPGNKIIEEYVGRVNTRESQVSIARMRSPAGWSEPGQRPDFDEFTVVLNGTLHVQHDKGVLEVKAGQAVVTRKGEWVRYSTPQGALNMWLFACQRSLRTRSIGTHENPLRLNNIPGGLD